MNIFTSKPLLGIALVAVFAISGHAQCVDSTVDDPCISVHQSTLDRAAKAVNELTEARKVIEAFSKERIASEVERQAYKNALDVSASALAIFQKGITDRERLIELQDKAIQAMAQLNDKLIQQMGKPRSAWSKFLSAVKTILTLAAGVKVGQGL